jgi:hypothetical protein
MNLLNITQKVATEDQALDYLIPKRAGGIWEVEIMNRFAVVVVFFLVSLQPVFAQQKTCDKPYQIGRFVNLAGEDLRIDRSRAITKKENREWEKKQSQAQTVCNAFVKEHPNLAVSKDFSFTIKGFMTVNERCESFCGTYEDLDRLYQEEVNKIPKKPKN